MKGTLGRRNFRPASAMTAVCLLALGGAALAAQDRYTLKTPGGGPAWSEFRGYETWQPVAVSQTQDGLKLISANAVMMKAYRAGLPASGKTFPEGSKVVKIEWTPQKNTASPYFVNVPKTVKSVSFIEKDSKRYPKTHGWAYAQFVYDPASNTFKSSVNGPECGFACHTRVAAQDYIFTAYPPR